jgi:glycosyltransferase involved in cell wall biosynthesis
MRSMPRLGLHMIVKDEAPVIERCLASVRPLVDWWVVSDTGSTDGTQDLVRSAMAGLPGVLLERPWVSFGHNRQEALDAARGLEHAGPDDHVLWLDADEQLVDLPARLPELTADGYHLQVEFGSMRYHRLAVVRLARPWRWTGAIHEYLDLPGATIEELSAPRVLVRSEGARSRDPETYRTDAAVIEAELRRAPHDPRMQFYLGQSWRDAGEPEKALAAYRTRAANADGWQEERWYALFQVGVLLERLGASPEEISSAYLAAFQADANRAEPLVELARYERLSERYDVALLYARAAARVPAPGPQALFVDVDTYAWRAWDEVAVSSYWAGRYADGVIAAQKALAVRPDDERLRANLAWCQDKLGAR